MEAPNPAEDFLAAGLASLGVEADEVELAVITVAHATFWPPILELLELDAGAVAPEPDVDLSRPPAAA